MIVGALDKIHVDWVKDMTISSRSLTILVSVWLRLRPLQKGFTPQIFILLAVEKWGRKPGQFDYMIWSVHCHNVLQSDVIAHVQN